MQIFDSHAHYNDEKFELDREETLKKVLDAGVKNLICAGYSVESSRQAIKIANEHRYIYATAGISPNDIPTFENENTDVKEFFFEEVLNEQLKEIKKLYSDIDVIAGNIATSEGAKALIDAGVDAIKIGIGAGSICTTRIIAGIGVPQLTAILDASQIAKKNNVGSIADGGIKYSGDIIKAFAVGADAIMAGGLFSSTYEAPGDVIIIDGKKYKPYRGMGSVGAMIQGSKDRYFQSEVINKSKFVPEGIEGVTEYKGHVADVIYQIIGGVRAGMGYVGAKNIDELQEKAEFVKITNQGLAESHVHDVKITSKAPNY